MSNINHQKLRELATAVQRMPRRIQESLPFRASLIQQAQESRR
ncbi:hypothetical protein BvCmsKKNP021_02570 [Escherichia coli]|nr:hypothetical protein BvCmsKKNP017_02246 [Escherichia coli]GDH73971.1 hypothetical protein BvCmsKKNP021_02570 [Escherichia coli]